MQTKIVKDLASNWPGGKLKLWHLLFITGIVVYVVLQGAAGFEPIVLFSLVPLALGLLGSFGFKYEKRKKKRNLGGEL